MPLWRTAETRLQQNDVRCVSSNVYRGGYRNTDIGGMQGGGVIDPVSHIAHDVAAAFEGMNDAVFLHRRDAREYRRLFRPVLERGIAGRFELLTQHDPRILDADLFANVTCHQFVVAGQDFDVNAIALHGHD